MDLSEQNQPCIRAEIIRRPDQRFSVYASGPHEAESLPTLCRALIDAGHDPASRLEAHRGAMLCIRVRSIGEAAGVEVDGHRSRFVTRKVV